LDRFWINEIIDKNCQESGKNHYSNIKHQIIGGNALKKWFICVESNKNCTFAK